MIAFDRVSKRYPSGQQALANLSFALARGEFAFITGHSGAGKSTLLKLVLGIERPSGGSLVVNGHDLMAMSPNMLPSYRRQIGTVFQDHQLLNDRSVFDNVALPLEISGLDPREGKRRVRAALDKVGLLSKERMSPMALSGGEQQRVALARALAPNPKLVFADEPTGNLDAANGASIVDSLFTLTQDQADTTLILVTHDVQLAQRCDRIIDLRDGKICESPGA